MQAELPPMHITDIRIKPIKSSGDLEVFQGGVFTLELQQAILTPHGLETKEGIGDHTFMWIRAIPGEDGVHAKITQRDKRDTHDRTQGFSDLAHIKPQWHDGNLHLTWDRNDPIVLPLDRNTGVIRKVEVWDDICLAVDQGDAIATWASDHLHYAVRLVKAAGPFVRRERTAYLTDDIPRGVTSLLFHDGYPTHFITRESLAELNERAKVLSEQSGGKIPYNEIKWQSFRPQLVLEGLPPNDEHKIHKGSIAGVIFYDPKPCDRCPMPRVDQETGKLNPLDPNTVLSSYKLWRNIEGKKKTIMGENMNPQGTETIIVGDGVATTELRNPPLVFGATV